MSEAVIDAKPNRPRQGGTLAPRVLLAMPLDGIFRAIARGFNSVACQRRWIVHVVTGSNVDQMLEGIDPDIVLLCGERHTWASPRWLSGRVVVGTEITHASLGYPSAVVDGAAIGRLAAEHLIAEGYRHLAAFNIVGHPWSESRLNAFRQTVEQAGKHYCPGGDNFDPSPGSLHTPDTPGVTRWLQSLPKPAGVMGCCDGWAHVITWTCQEAALRIPEDIAVLGVDNEELLCELSRPPMSSVMIPWERIGSEAAMLAEHLLRGGPPPAGPVLVPPSGVAQRRSTDPLAVSDPDVRDTLDFIRTHASRPLDVPTILRHIPVSRKTLQQKFRSLLGRSIMDEVHRIQLERAKRLLAATDLSTEEIAAQCGFSSASRLSEAFSRQLKQTPSAFRRQLRVR